MRRAIAPVALLALVAGQTTVSAETMTVQSLLNSGYAVVGIFTSKVGWPGVFLQKDKSLILCFVGETPSSISVDTQYCKPVK